MALREVNLIPADILHKKYVIRHIALWGVALMLCLVLIVGFYQYQVRVVLPSKRPATTLEGMHHQLGATAEEIKATRQELQRLSHQESFLKTLSTVQPFTRLLLRLSKNMNAQTWLTELTLAAGSEQEAIESGMELNGFSLSNEDLGNFLTQLSEEPLFQNVKLKYANETRIPASPQGQKGLIKVIEFQIYCKIPRI